MGQQSCAVPWSSALLLLRPHLWVTQGQSRAAPLLPMGPTGTSSNRPAEAQSRSCMVEEAPRRAALLPMGKFPPVLLL